MAKIDTLVEDIYKRISEPKEFLEENIQRFAHGLARKISSKLSEERQKPSLRMSNLGTKCGRKLWYYVNSPDLAEPLPPYVRLKFLFGDILEEMLLFLARESGHTVENEQEEVELYGVVGHRDGDIDGVPVDCKSASSRSFEKFAKGLTPEEDSFGYLTQLDSYRETQKKEEAALFVIDKQFGHLCLDRHKPLGVDYEKLIAEKRELLVSSTPPSRTYEAVPDGKSGNMKLGVVCSYCPFKEPCWPELRTFLYASGPRSLTKVMRLPDVPEV